jgi:hypothetical protein
MKTIWDLHWLFIRQPTVAIRDHIPTWPVNVGIGFSLFFVVSAWLQDARSLSMMESMLGLAFGVQDPALIYFILALMAGYGLAIDYFLQPWVVRQFLRTRPESINDRLVRQIIFYSSTSFLIFAVFVSIPITIVQTVVVSAGELQTWAIVVISLLSLISIWSLVPAINIAVIRWIGLREHFRLSTGQLFLTIFVVPLIAMLPYIAMMAPTVWRFISRSVS